MKSIYKKLSAFALAAPMLLSSCIEETFPTSGVTGEQLSQSSSAMEATLGGMPAYMRNWHTWSSNAFDFGYPSIIIATNVMTNDMLQEYSGYQHFLYWQEVNLALNSGYVLSQINWYYLNFMVRTTNSAVSAIPAGTTDPAHLRDLASSITFRASTYLDMARIYEWLPNADISSVNEAGNDISGLTVPIVTDETPDEQLENNPRASHDDMVAFLEGDLLRAIDLFQQSGVARRGKAYPDLAVAYGVLARVYAWDENYPKAAEYARLAINASGATPLSQSEWFDKSRGFNDSSLNSWMWAIEQESNDEAVTTGQSSNWTSFMSAESTIGYSGRYQAYMCIDARLYSQINDNDWRKLSWKAPAGSALAGREPYIDATQFAGLSDYTGIKFRPGQGVVGERSVTFATDIPLMRVEEMYLLEAEATAHTNPAQGKTLLENFMQTYRYPQYTCVATDEEGVVDACFLQKRIEFWGENVIFFDYKRLDKSVDRAYDGSNWPSTARFRTVGRPGWMCWPFVDYEGDFNKGVEGYLNPNIGEKFSAV